MIKSTDLITSFTVVQAGSRYSPNPVKPAGNRNSWIKSGARWRDRARNPAPANWAPKILPTWKVGNGASFRPATASTEYGAGGQLALWLRHAFPSYVCSYQALTFYPALAYG